MVNDVAIMAHTLNGLSPQGLKNTLPRYVRMDVPIVEGILIKGYVLTLQSFGAYNICIDTHTQTIHGNVPSTGATKDLALTESAIQGIISWIKDMRKARKVRFTNMVEVTA